ncbi:MAG: lipopolysaccharide assembly protein LapA domain-containing protein [Gaiellaceae bacterium]
MADEQAKRERPPWIQLTAIGLVALYAILFIVLNTHRAKVSFVFGTTRISVIWVILLSLAVGFVLGVLGARLNRRRKRRG